MSSLKNSRDFSANHLFSLSLELSTECNLDCVMCRRRSLDFSSRPRFMSRDIWNKLTKDLISQRVSFDALYLFWLSEPTLHPEFVSIFKSALELSVKHHLWNIIEFDTNATVLGYQDYLEILKFQADLTPDQIWQRIYFSIDAASDSTYRKIRANGELIDVEAGILSFLQAGADVGKFPKSALVYVIMEENAGELPDFIDYWTRQYKIYQRDLTIVSILDKDSFDSISSLNDIILLRPLSTSKQLQPQANSLYRQSCEQLKHKFNLPLHFSSPWSPPPSSLLQASEQSNSSRCCDAFLYRPLILTNGQIQACFNDDLLELTAGNIIQNDFLSCWKNFGAKMSRKFETGNYPDKCLNRCQGILTKF